MIFTHDNIITSRIGYGEECDIALSNQSILAKQINDNIYLSSFFLCIFKTYHNYRKSQIESLHNLKENIFCIKYLSKIVSVSVFLMKILDIERHTKKQYKAYYLFHSTKSLCKKKQNVIIIYM